MALVFLERHKSLTPKDGAAWVRACQRLQAAADKSLWRYRDRTYAVAEGLAGL